MDTFKALNRSQYSFVAFAVTIRPSTSTTSAETRASTEKPCRADR